MHDGGMAIYFATAIGGYWVLERAESHKEGSLRRIGRVLGLLIILLSFISAAFSSWAPSRHRMWKKGMHRGGYEMPPPRGDVRND
jgi:hypothetical protein